MIILFHNVNLTDNIVRKGLMTRIIIWVAFVYSYNIQIDIRMEAFSDVLFVLQYTKSILKKVSISNGKHFLSKGASVFL